MQRTKAALVIPPHRDPCQPSRGAAQLFASLCGEGKQVQVIDAALEAFYHFLQPDRLGSALSHVNAALEDLEKQPHLSYQQQFQYRRLARAAVACPAALQESREGLAALRQTDADWERAQRSIRRGLELISAEFCPTQWTWTDYHMRLAWQSSEQATQAAAHPANVFARYLAEHVVPMLSDSDEVWQWCEAGAQLVPALTLARLVKQEWPCTPVVLAGPLVRHLHGITERDGTAIDRVIDTGPDETTVAPDYSGFPVNDYLAPKPLLACPGTLRHTELLRLASQFPEAILEVTGPVAHDCLWSLATAFADQSRCTAWVADLAAPPPPSQAPSLAKLLARAGCREVALNVAVSSPRLQRLGYGFDPAAIDEWLRACQATNLPVRIRWHVGFPSDSRSEAEETLVFLRNHAELLSEFHCQVFRLEHGEPLVGRLLEQALITRAGKRRDWDPYLQYVPAGGMSASEALAVMDAANQELNRLLPDAVAPSRAHAALSVRRSAQADTAGSDSQPPGLDDWLTLAPGVTLRELKYNLQAIESLVYERDLEINRLLDQPGVDLSVLLARWDQEIPPRSPEPHWVLFIPQRDRISRLPSQAASALTRFRTAQPVHAVAQQLGLAAETLGRLLVPLMAAGALVRLSAPVMSPTGR